MAEKENNKNKKELSLYKKTLLIMIAAIILLSLPALSSEFCDWYNDNVYGILCDAISHVTALFPFAVGEILMYTGVMMLIVAVVLLLLLIFLHKKASYRRFCSIYYKFFCLADTINAVNVKIGMTENFWEHRSFKEQGLDIIPQIHLGEKASAMERAGIRTIRGDINRDIIAKNAIIDVARAVYQKAKEELEAVKAIPVTVVKAVKNEILDVIRKVAERNNNLLSLPIMKGKYIGAVSDRASLQDRAKMETYVQGKGWTTFAEMQAERKSVEAQYDQLNKSRGDICSRMDYLEKLLDMHKKYEPYQKVNAEYWKLKKAEETKGKGGILGFAKKSVAEEFKKTHQTELTTYRMYRDVLKRRDICSGTSVRNPVKSISIGQCSNLP